MVNAIGSAAQQISSNLSKLKEQSAAGTQNADTDSMQDHSSDSADSSKSTAGSTNLGSKVAKGLIRLHSVSGDDYSEKPDQATARNGVDVRLSREAKEMLKSS